MRLGFLLAWPARRDASAILVAFAGIVGLAGLTGCGESSAGVQSAPEVRGAPIRAKTQKADSSTTNVAGSGRVATALNTPAATPTNTAPASVASAANPDPGKPVTLGFDQLSGYTFEVTDELLGPVTNDLALAAEKTNSKIPAPVKSYDRKKVALRGFMLPLKVEGGLVTEMLIMKDQSMCCYGTTPRINDWVSVRMKNKGVRATMDLPVTLYGTIRVGEMRENGYLVGIYSMDGEEMEAPDLK